MKTYLEFGTEIGALVEEKNAAYGSSFAKCGAFLRLLFPEGVGPESYEDMLLLARIFDKQMRIATDRDAFGESPFSDIAGYGILGAHLHWQRKEKEAAQECATSRRFATASEDAVENAKVPRDFVAHGASKSTQTRGSEAIESEQSQQPSNSSEPPAFPPVAAVMGAASVSAEGRPENLLHEYEYWLYRSNVGRCAACGCGCSCNIQVGVKGRFGWVKLRVCSSMCEDFCYTSLSRDEVGGCSL